MERLEGIILAAGFSKRMGRFKALLPFNGMSIIERTINAMGEVAEKIYIVGAVSYTHLRAHET